MPPPLKKKKKKGKSKSNQREFHQLLFVWKQYLLLAIEYFCWHLLWWSKVVRELGSFIVYCLPFSLRYVWILNMHKLKHYCLLWLSEYPVLCLLLTSHASFACCPGLLLYCSHSGFTTSPQCSHTKTFLIQAFCTTPGRLFPHIFICQSDSHLPGHHSNITSSRNIPNIVSSFNFSIVCPYWFPLKRISQPIIVFFLFVNLSHTPF